VPSCGRLAGRVVEDRGLASSTASTPPLGRRAAPCRRLTLTLRRPTLTLPAAKRPARAQSLLDALLGARDDAGAGMGRRALRDELMTLLVAGQETAAVALAWACALLAHCPAAQARCRPGVRGGPRAAPARAGQAGHVCAGRVRGRVGVRPGHPSNGAARILLLWPAAGRSALVQAAQRVALVRVQLGLDADAHRPVLDEPARTA